MRFVRGLRQRLSASGSPHDTYPVMVDEGHCIRCQHCLAVPTGLFHYGGRQPLIARRFVAISRSPANWIATLFKGRRLYGTISAKRFARVASRASRQWPTRLPAAMRRICWFRLSPITAAHGCLSGGCHLRLDELAETGAMPDCRAFFLFPPESSGRPGCGTAFSVPLRIA